jgi:hypothetical protein
MGFLQETMEFRPIPVLPEAFRNMAVYELTGGLVPLGRGELIRSKCVFAWRPERPHQGRYFKS